MKNKLKHIIGSLSLAILSAIVLVAIITAATSQNSFAAVGDITQINAIKSGTLSLTGSVGQQSTITTIPANSPAFVLTTIDVVALTSSTITAVPSFSIKNGSTTLSGSTALTGTGAAQVTRVSLSPPVIIATSTAAQPIVYNLLVAGTATSLNGRVFIHGFNNQ